MWRIKRRVVPISSRHHLLTSAQQSAGILIAHECTSTSPRTPPHRLGNYCGEQEDYSPADNCGLTFPVAMETIHGITAAGEVLTGVQVFQKAYKAVGLGWVYGQGAGSMSCAAVIPHIGPLKEQQRLDGFHRPCFDLQRSRNG